MVSYGSAHFRCFKFFVTVDLIAMTILAHVLSSWRSPGIPEPASVVLSDIASSWQDVALPRGSPETLPRVQECKNKDPQEKGNCVRWLWEPLWYKEPGPVSWETRFLSSWYVSAKDHGSIGLFILFCCLVLYPPAAFRDLVPPVPMRIRGRKSSEVEGHWQPS